MNKFLILFLTIHFFASCQKKQSINLDGIRNVNNFEYNSLTENTSKKTLNESFKNILDKTTLYSKNGEYWENMKFNLYPICFV